MAPRDCVAETPGCPVELTVLGYRPSLGGNAFFAAAFGICALAILFVGVRKKTWAFSLFVAAGSVLEMAGYIGRVLMHKNVWDDSGFKLQITAIVLAPTLICAGIYLTLKHLSLALSPSLSRVKPRLYPLFFLPADVSCLVLQAIGGGVAASANNDKPKVLESGNRLIVAGIALQVVVLLLFGAAAGEYLWRVRAEVRRSGGESIPAWGDRKLRIFLWAVVGAYFAIFIRCVYRIAEMAGGWGNHIMQEEVTFMVLDGALVLLAIILLTIFAPGIFFPQMAEQSARERKAKSEKKKGGSSPEMSESTS